MIKASHGPRMEETYYILWIIYTNIFMLMYAILTAVCIYAVLIRTASPYIEAARGKKLRDKNNSIKNDVILALVVGSGSRLISFLDLPDKTGEILLGVKDFCWIYTYASLLVFLIELQTYTHHNTSSSNVEKLRPRLHVTMGIYFLVRVFEGVVNVLYESDNIINILAGVVHLIAISSIWMVSVIYSINFIRKFLSTDKRKHKSIHSKFQYFMALSNIAVIMFMVIWSLRRATSSNWRCNDENVTCEKFQDRLRVDATLLDGYTKTIEFCEVADAKVTVIIYDTECYDLRYFLLKLFEKILEFAMISLLCFAMLAKSQVKQKGKLHQIVYKKMRGLKHKRAVAGKGVTGGDVYMNHKRAEAGAGMTGGGDLYMNQKRAGLGLEIDRRTGKKILEVTRMNNQQEMRNERNNITHV